MQRLSNPKHAQSQAAQPPTFEKTIHFSQAQALIWQIRIILNQINSKKMMAAASNELANLSQQFGKDFDKYLLKEMIDYIDLKNPAKAQKDKNEPFNIQLFNQEFARCSQKPDFLLYFSEIAQHCYNDRMADFLSVLSKRLKLSYTNQLLIALSFVESCREENQAESFKILKQALVDYHNYGKPEPLPEYAVHKLLYHLTIAPELVIDQIFNHFCQKDDESLRDIGQYIVDSNALKPQQSSIYLRSPLQQDLMYANISPEDPSNSLLKEGMGLSHLDKSFKILEPWQVLLELGHYTSYNYNYLVKALEDFRDINEKTMARTLLILSINNTGQDESNSRIAQNILEASKRGDCSGLKKDIVDKKTQMYWSTDTLARAFRELYSNLSMLKVFEALTEIEDDLQLDQKAFQTFLSLFNKLKPQNLSYPLHVILNREWANPSLQLNFIDNSIQSYIEKKDKSIQFSKTERRQEVITEITGYDGKVAQEILHVWLSVDLVETLITLSDSHQFLKVRNIFESPMKNIPDYLLLTLSQAKPKKGNLMIDELLSLLLPQFLGNHINSIPVLQTLWKNNQALMIRGICELCRHDQRIMNLSRVLDITQEVKESLIPIVNCEDYYFAVNLGILAGKRDFLHYDVWLQSRIAEVGTPFIKALIKYMKEHIIMPIIEYQRRAQQNHQNITADQLEQHKVQVLERSHLSKEKLCITIEHLSNQQNRSNPKIKEETLDQIRDIVTSVGEFFPNQVSQSQNSDEIDNAANDYFQKVFSADPNQVDQKIIELIETMQRFKESEVKKEQEIYACMLHSLFDEYRFLHRYPQQYLEKIAKLFGAIIKHRIIDGTLQEIALKFAFEAFRREGKRQRFGVITIKQFFDMLPQFPQFFEDIYEIRNNIQTTDPQMIKDIEDLYERTMKKSKDDEKPAKADEVKSKTQEDSRQQQPSQQEKKEFVPQQQQQQQTPISNINSQDFQKIFQGSIDNKQQQPQQPKPQNALGATQSMGNPQRPMQQNPILDPNARTSTPTPINQIPPYFPQPRKGEPSTFIPQGQQPFPSLGGQMQSQPGLSTASVEFVRAAPTKGQQQPPQAQPQQVPQNPMGIKGPQQLPVGMGIGGANIFRPPTNIRSPLPMNQQITPQALQMQQQIDQKLQKAQLENTKLRVEELVEDSNMTGPTPEVQEQIKLICNQTGKNNFTQKLEELKALINQNPIQNINWFIHHILTKRLSQSTNLHPLYIDMIKQSGIKEAVAITIQQTVDIFKRCMLIDEMSFMNVAQRSAQSGNLIKQFLINLGAFLGGITIAQNRPILAKELDIKQLLVEGYQSDKLRYVVVFVCRIFKECSKSTIFKHQNPWIKANLEILREIFENAQMTNINGSQNEILMEIDALIKSFSIQSISEIQNSGFLKAAQTRDYQNSSQQAELLHLQKKNTLIPAVPVIQSQQQQQQPPQIFPGGAQALSQIAGAFGPRNTMSPSPLGFPIFGQPPRIMTPNNQNEMGHMGQGQKPLQHQEIFSRVVVSPEILNLLGRQAQSKEQALRKLVAEAVDSSIVEILPPVVDRSVTIALITTRELVLKDFAFDGNYNKILKAADLIVQNLAGSLALVTCREPLKMSLTTNLKRSLQQLSQQMAQEGEQLTENQVNDISQHASRENLELGCKLIKKSVIEKALTKVREDPSITRAIEARKQAQQQGIPHYQDENLVSQFQDLPPQLKPSTTGLTDAQFQVYEDFQKLMPKKSVTDPSAQLLAENEGMQYDISQLLNKFEQQSRIDNVLEYQLTEKLKRMAKDADTEEQVREQAKEHQKLLQYCQKWLFIIAEKFNSSTDKEQLASLLDILTFIVQKYKVDDISKKLTSYFLQLDESYLLNVELTVSLLQKGIISIPYWDQQIAISINENQQFQSDSIFTFIKEFLEFTIGNKVFSYLQFPNLMAVLQKVSAIPTIGKYFQQILEEYSSKATWNKDKLRDYFLEWAELSFEEQSPKQEQEVNKFFNNLQQMGVYKESETMQNFCVVMVEISIERALYTQNGVKRPTDRLDYRYIYSLLQIMVVLLNTSDINKHEFMSRLFEAILQVLDEDHKNKKCEFNQKPYYRLLNNILKAVNNSQFINPKTRMLILHSLADLLIKLNPNKYPAFSFAWLQLISHKEFMPIFLRYYLDTQPTTSNQQQPGSAPSQHSASKRGTVQQNIPQQQQQKQQFSSGGPQGAQQQISQNLNSIEVFKYKELIFNLFTFLKNNMIPGNKMSVPMVKFYEATLRIMQIIHHDYPEFLCDFHFNFVNSLPEHCIQLKNIILSAQPRSIPYHNPFSKNLKVDNLVEVHSRPRMQSNYDNYLQLMNLREDLENYFRTKNPKLIQVICNKMQQIEEVVGSKRKINSSIINAVALFIGNYAINQQNKTQLVSQKECYDTFKRIITSLNNETRVCLLNALVNELRYINNYTYFYSWIIIFLFSDNDETIQEQITRILIERLQVHEPHPWGLCITFRELLQNPKYAFTKKSFVVQNQAVIEQLMQTRLLPFNAFWQNQRQANQQQQQQQQIAQNNANMLDQQ